jgi:hypothetical protein
MTRRDDLYARAKKALGREDEARWEAAEAITQLYELGETQRQIADRLGCSSFTVNTYLAVFRDCQDNKKRPSFTEAMAQVRGPRQQVEIPKSPEKRAALVADLLKEKAVADAPAVRKVTEQHADRRIRADAAAFNKEHGVATRTEGDRDKRRLSVVNNSSFWFRILGDIQHATRTLGEATGEVERTGLPRSGSGEMVRATRALIRAAQRFEQAATDAGIGQAM